MKAPLTNEEMAKLEKYMKPILRTHFARVIVTLFDRAISELKELRKSLTPKPGTCQYCGCTESDPCIVFESESLPDYVPCSWIDETRTVCSLSRCQMRHRITKP